MVTQKDIQATCDDIVREFAPLQVILFGSYACGTATEDSDVDLLVVMDIPESETRRQAVEIRQRIPHRFSIDLLVRSPEEMAYRISHNDWFLREITERGEVLYGYLNYADIPFKQEKCVMNPLTLGWIDKAEGDYTTVKILQQNPISSKDVICFHAQQCIEKYLRVWLQEENIPVPRTHNLEELLNLIVSIVPAWNAWKSGFSILAEHAVEFRYPGKSATAENAEHAVNICDVVRQDVRKELKLPENQSDLC